jgi:hypothetical protein
MSNNIDHVHETTLAVETVELTPPHAERRETETYRKSHHFLVVERDSPCLVCGVRNSTLSDPAKNPFSAKALESHHYPVEWSLAHACDPRKVHEKFPQVIDRATLEAFIDSPPNLLILCDLHHRSMQSGIHHLLAQDFAILPFLIDGYIVVSDKTNATQAETHDAEVLGVTGKGIE